MMDRSRFLRAAEFKQKSRWSSVWPNMRYGSMFLSYGVGRKLPMKGVNWVTRDSNRLLNFSNRYSAVIADIDVKRTEEELGIQLSDIRWNDHRRIYWRCSFCGSPYRKSVSVRTKFHAGCNFCKGKYPSEVLREQHENRPLATSAPALVEQLADSDKRENLSSLSQTSKFRAEWKCQNCDGLYRATIRSRTGMVESGQCTLHPDIASWSSYCPSCSWKPNMNSIAEERYAKGYKPIPNPITFDSDAHCRSYHREQRECAGMSGILVTCRCDKCQRVHSLWKVMDFQEFLDAKASMSPEKQKELLWPSAVETVDLKTAPR